MPLDPSSETPNWELKKIHTRTHILACCFIFFSLPFLSLSFLIKIIASD
jgi:hypothetical protein